MEFLKFGSRAMTSPVMNGAGFCKDAGLAKALAQTKAGAVVLGSITVLPREGNSGNVYFFDEEHGLSINSIGLRNPGAKFYIKELPIAAEFVHSCGKPLIVSIAGFSVENYLELAEIVMDCDVDAIELNLGCPNGIDNGLRHPIAAYDPVLIYDITSGVREVVGDNPNMSVGIKVSPYYPDFLKQVAVAVRDTKLVDFVTVSNTWPYTLVLKSDGTNAIDVPDGFGGGAGPGMFPIALGQVRQWQNILGNSLPIIASGGCTYPKDVKAFLSVGAQAVQVTTYLFEAHAHTGIEVINDLITDN